MRSGQRWLYNTCEKYGVDIESMVVIAPKEASKRVSLFTEARGPGS